VFENKRLMRSQEKEYAGYVRGKKRFDNIYGRDIADGKNGESWQEAVEWVLGEEGNGEKWIEKDRRKGEAGDERRKGERGEEEE